MKYNVLLILTSFCFPSFGQFKYDKQTDPIVEEGKRLYRSEMASWYGTDLFLENYEQREKIGGYFSYEEGEKVKCVFFSNSNLPLAIGTISFDSTYNTETASINLDERKLTEFERDLFEIRRKALAVMQNDTLFKRYQNVSWNIIPLIQYDSRKVYVLSSSQIGDVVIFGNDYLIEFDKENTIIEKKRIHQNIIPVEYATSQENGENDGIAMHTHSGETGYFITATDICTIMLYCKYANWNSHNVVSKKFLNIWNCKTNSLAVIPMETVRKINDDQKNNRRKEKFEKKKKKREEKEIKQSAD